MTHKSITACGTVAGILIGLCMRSLTAQRDTFDWTDGSLSLAAFAGQPVLLELVTDPGQYDGSGADYDWAHWLVFVADQF